MEHRNKQLFKKLVMSLYGFNDWLSIAPIKDNYTLNADKSLKMQYFCTEFVHTTYNLKLYCMKTGAVWF